MQISELLAIPRLHLRFLSGSEQVHRDIRLAYTTDLLEPKRYLRGGELVLTGMMWHNSPADSETFVSSLVEADVACLAAGTALGEVPSDLIEACRRHDLPLLEVPSQTSFGAVTEEVLRLLTKHRFTTITETHHRHRKLMADVAAGADFPEVFAAAAAEAGINAWVIASTGRQVAASGPDMSTEDRAWLAARALTRPASPFATAMPTTTDPATTRTVTLVPVQTRESHPLAGWTLVCSGDHADWPEETREAVAELSSIAVLARSRIEENALNEARHVEGLPRLLAAQRFDEVAALLHVGAEGAPDTGHIVISAMVQPEPRVPDLARRIVCELLAEWPGAVVTGDNDVLAVVPVPEAAPTAETGTRGGARGAQTGARADSGTGAAERLRRDIGDAARVLEAGLTDHRLAIGIGSTVRGIPELRGAAVEARHARRLAELRDGRAQIIAGAEIDSHELLLASVPEEVQSSYRDRLLGPLLTYDHDHRSELVRTLERFLEHSGSWQRCAAAMHVHVNTLRYRIGRIEELTGRDLSNLEHRVDLFLALKLRD
ncbi:PucR family transcriptional regulator [Nocardiopsis gilva YIM 90087]|uniref:PucR family transcriptional regulator n=1 Tax=Nocardiopsis gilva YIM 90087 TaxID=1235441 RepID=A0A223S807_9ACTN|nr:PucR family transcriptional regulator [Nocardiopsis gilva]ASU84236.1 PucR family transcriptional regulator [Nocardiopsis gilva YIM 90087]